MIFTERQITIRNGKSSIDEPVILYRGDFEVSIKFTIMESKFRFKSGVNLVDSEKASHGQLAILTPYGGNVFSEIVKCADGTVTFTLTKEMIDQLEEVGLYSFQIRLFDYYRESRVSIPPVEFGIEVREPVASEDHDNEVNNAIVGYSIAKVVDGLNEDVGPTFDDEGQYNKTDWKTGDRITEGKLNKIEDALDKINQNEKSDKNALNKQMTSNFNVLQNRIDNIIKLENGSTTGDIELIDGRIGIDGNIYSTIGDGIRSQLNRICTSRMLSYALLSSGARTFSIDETGMILGKKYQIKIESYTGVCNVNKIDIIFTDSDGNSLKRYNNLNIGDSIYCEILENSANMKCLFYIDGEETYNARFKISVTNLITDALYKEQFNEIDDAINKLQDTILTSYIPLRYSLVESGVRTFNLNEIGIKTNDSYFIKIENYTGVCNVNKIDIGFIDSNGNNLIQYSNLNIGDCVYCEVPTDAVSLRFLFYIDGTEQDISTFTMTVFKYTLEDVINEKLKRLTKTKKIINCLGDSFTAANTSWHTFIGDRLGYEMINLGVAGTRISNTYTSGSGTTYTGFIDRVKNGVLNVDADLTIIFGGINDTVRVNNNQLEIGEVDDEVGANTFCGKLKELIELIWTKMPGKPILGVIPPLYSEGTSDHEWWYEILLLIQEAEREVYKNYGIPYVDLKYNSQEMHINDYNLSTYRINGLNNMHPSTKGYEAISIPIQKGIEKMFID